MDISIYNPPFSYIPEFEEYDAEFLFNEFDALYENKDTQVFRSLAGDRAKPFTPKPSKSIVFIATHCNLYQIDMSFKDIVELNKNKTFVGASPYLYEFEINRKAGNLLGKRLGFSMIPKKTIYSLDELKKEMEKEGKYVIKNYKETIIGSREYLLSRMEAFPIFPSVLEPYIEGMDVDFCFLKSRNRVILFSLDFQHKNIGEDGTGWLIGEAGTVSIVLGEEEPIYKLFINCISLPVSNTYISATFRFSFDDGKLYFLEWNTRWFGFPEAYEYHKLFLDSGISIPKLVRHIIDEQPIKIKPKSHIVSCVVLLPMNPSPAPEFLRLQDDPYPDYSKLMKFGVFPSSASVINKKLMFYSYGTIISQTGETLSESINKMYKTLSLNLNIHHANWRTDIGTLLLEDGAKYLHKAGLITTKTYQVLSK